MGEHLHLHRPPDDSPNLHCSVITQHSANLHFLVFIFKEIIKKKSCKCFRNIKTFSCVFLKQKYQQQEKFQLHKRKIFFTMEVATHKNKVPKNGIKTLEIFRSQ